MDKFFDKCGGTNLFDKYSLLPSWKEFIKLVKDRNLRPAIKEVINLEGILVISSRLEAYAYMPCSGFSNLS